MPDNTADEQNVVPCDAEEDKPFGAAPVPLSRLSEKQQAQYEANGKKLEQANHPGFTKTVGVKFLWCSLAVLVFLTVADAVTYNVWKWETRPTLTPLVETVKFIMSSMTGFLFAKQGEKG